MNNKADPAFSSQEGTFKEIKSVSDATWDSHSPGVCVLHPSRLTVCANLLAIMTRNYAALQHM